MKPLLLFQAPIQTRSGYGEHSRDLLHCLIKMDKFDIRVWGTRWGDTSYINLDTDKDREIFKRMLVTPAVERQPDVYVQVTIPQEFQAIGKYNIGITAGIETTHCSAQWIEGINRMNLVLVPSKHAKDVFVKTSYTRHEEGTNKVLDVLKTKVPIEVLFEGADTSAFFPTTNISPAIRHALSSIPEQFLFLFVGHWLKGDLFQDRKDISGLIKTFYETFKGVTNAPALLLKTSTGTNSVLDRNQILSNIEAIRNTMGKDKKLPNVYVLHGELTQDEMNSLYNHSKIKAHVSFTKGEGFGRPLLEASLSQKPVIASNWSGHIDFLNNQLSILLPGQLTQVHQSAVWEPIIIAQSSWFTVNYRVAANVLMNVWKNYAKFKDNAMKQAIYSSQNFSLKKMQVVFDELLKNNLPAFPKEIPIVIPKLDGLKLPKLKPITPVSETTIDGINAINANSPELPIQKNEHEVATPQSSVDTIEEKPNEDNSKK